MRTSPFTFVSKTVRSSSSVDSVNGSRPSARPAAFTSMSAGPAASTKRSQLAGIGDVELERDLRLEPLDAAGAADDPRALASAEHARVAAPMPLEAPVTIAVLPSSRSMAGHVTGRAAPGGYAPTSETERLLVWPSLSPTTALRM